MAGDLLKTVKLIAPDGTTREFEFETALISLTVADVAAAVSTDSMHADPPGSSRDWRALCGTATPDWSDKFGFLSKTEATPEEDRSYRFALDGEGDENSRIYASQDIGFGVSVSPERFTLLWESLPQVGKCDLHFFAEVEAYRPSGSPDSRVYFPTWRAARVLSCTVRLERSKPSAPQDLPVPPSPADKELGTIKNLLWALLAAVVVMALTT